MLNSTILLKVRQRLNKLASLDYDNIQDWQIIEAFNKGQVEWSRRQLHGMNLKKEGDEQSRRRVDDMQVLLKSINMNLTKRNLFYETSGSLPEDYMEYKKLSITATNDCCTKPSSMVVYLAEEENVDILLRDINKQPNFDWRETFITIGGNKIRIYTNNEFEIKSANLRYYKQPTRIEIIGVQDPYTGIISTTDVESDFNEDVIELLIDECSKIIAGDIESFNQMQRMAQSAEQNN